MYFTLSHLPPGVKKATQELYGLINFGELRKKIGGTLDERKAQKLQELIRKGSTSVRVKGKSVRVRTPICRALKKLNQIEGVAHLCVCFGIFFLLRCSWILSKAVSIQLNSSASVVGGAARLTPIWHC